MAMSGSGTHELLVPAGNASPGRPKARQPDPEDPVALAETRALHRALENDDLLAEGQILGGDHGARHKKQSEKERDNGYDAHRQASVWVL